MKQKTKKTLKVTAIIIAIILLSVLLYNIFFIVSGGKVSKLLETEGLEITVRHTIYDEDYYNRWRNLGFYRLTEAQIDQIQDLFKKARFKKYNKTTWTLPLMAEDEERIFYLFAREEGEIVFRVEVWSERVTVGAAEGENWVTLYDMMISNMHWREFENEFFRICTESGLIKEETE